MAYTDRSDILALHEAFARRRPAAVGEFGGLSHQAFTWQPGEGRLSVAHNEDASIPNNAVRMSFFTMCTPWLLRIESRDTSLSYPKTESQADSVVIAAGRRHGTTFVEALQ